MAIPTTGHMKLPKPKTCRECKCKFTPTRAIQPVCDKFECKVTYAIKTAEKSAIARKKKEARQHREKKQKLKTRSDWIKEAQIEFNRYCRVRDFGRGCISCDSLSGFDGIRGGEFDAGHFLSRGAKPHLRFDERNCHAQCKRCNRYLSGNIANYRERLIVRIGLQEVLSLESNNQPAHWTIDDLKEIKRHYTQKTKELLKQRELLTNP
jgi:hypothetical protein